MPPTTGPTKPPPIPPVAALQQHQQAAMAAMQQSMMGQPGFPGGPPVGTPGFQGPPAAPRGATPHYSHFCGFLSNKGAPCKRPVTRAGERCLYHRDAASRTSFGGGATLAPNITLPMLEAGTPVPTKRGPGRPPKNPGMKNGKNPICGECGNDGAPSRLETDKSEDPMPNLMLMCSIDKSFWHAYCAEASTPAMIAKVVTYPWECSDCK